MGKSVNSKSIPDVLKVHQYFCDVAGCYKYFSKLSRLKYHQNTHLAEKPFKCQHEGCTSSYYRPNHLKRHVESIHKEETVSANQFKCEHEGCQAAFESEASLHYHTKRKHAIQPLKCSFCDKLFSKKWMFKEHEAGHTGAKPFKCETEDCGEEFRDYGLFKAHKRQHEKKLKDETKLHSCCVDDCKSTFAKWTDLVSHKKESHPPETKCSICLKSFTKGNLKRHMQVHEDQETRTSFLCPFDGCPKFYLYQRNLSHHMRVKHHDQGFLCRLCDQKLSSKQKLIEHHKKLHVKPRRKKKKRKTEICNSKVMDKIGTLTREDWQIKRPGPSRVIRKKSQIRFPESNKDATISRKRRKIEETRLNSETKECNNNNNTALNIDPVIESEKSL